MAAITQPVKYIFFTSLLGTLFWFSTFFSSEKQEEQPVPEVPVEPKPFVPMEKIQDFTIDEKLGLMLKDKGLEEWFSIEADGITMFASPLEKKQNKPECKIYFEEKAEFLKLFEIKTSEQLLSIYRKKGTKTFTELGLKIDTAEAKEELVEGNLLEGWKFALDPGHMGGSQEMAELEGKFVKIKEASGNIVKFNEGNLNLATVLLLQEKLEKLGAEVMLTRVEPEVTAFGMSYDIWLKDSLNIAVKKAIAKKEIDWKQASYLKKTDKKNVFHKFFKHREFMERARLINQFDPDLTLIVHFNVDEDNFLYQRDEQGNMEPSPKNYSMAFVPGSFMEGELEKPEERLAFLRLLLSESLKKSVLFSEQVCKRYETDLGVPAGNETTVRYLGTSCLYAGSAGVYARNLALSRLINSPLCYGEGLFQDNREEYLSLSKTKIVNGQPVPSNRIEEVTEMYFQAILAYAQKVSRQNL